MKAVFGFLLLGLVGEHRQLLQKTDKDAFPGKNFKV
jgi:hypothetical protein